MAHQCELVLGTHNRKKGLELQDLLEPYQFRVITLAELADPLKVEENGTTFGENAIKKASEQARHVGKWVLGEDSGLAVDALHGAPGVYSARFAGMDGDDEANNQRLLRELAGVPMAARTAHYVCHVALADPTGAVRVQFERTCNGRILESPVGDGGFGYDPLFEIMEYHRTFAQLGLAVKSVLSHRARAMRLLIPQLIRLRDNGMWRVS